jgi:DNA-binding FrmR family transcriptional regulator
MPTEEEQGEELLAILQQIAASIGRLADAHEKLAQALGIIAAAQSGGGVP